MTKEKKKDQGCSCVDEACKIQQRIFEREVDEELQQEHESPAYHVDGDEHGLLYRTFSHGGVFRKVSDSSREMKGSLVADRVYRVKVGGFLGRVPPEEYSGDGADKE